MSSPTSPITMYTVGGGVSYKGVQSLVEYSLYLFEVVTLGEEWRFGSGCSSSS